MNLSTLSREIMTPSGICAILIVQEPLSFKLKLTYFFLGMLIASIVPVVSRNYQRSPLYTAPELDLQYFELTLRMYACMCMCVCVCVCIALRMYVCMCMCVCVFVCVCVCICYTINHAYQCLLLTVAKP